MLRKGNIPIQVIFLHTYNIALTFGSDGGSTDAGSLLGGIVAVSTGRGSTGTKGRRTLGASSVVGNICFGKTLVGIFFRLLIVPIRGLDFFPFLESVLFLAVSWWKEFYEISR